MWKTNGCRNNCAQLVHQLSVADIIKYHDIYIQIPRSVKKQWLLNFFHFNTSGLETSYSVGGKPVCFEVWLSTTGICQSYYYKVKSIFKSGVVKLSSHVRAVGGLNLYCVSGL